MSLGPYGSHTLPTDRARKLFSEFHLKNLANRLENILKFFKDFLKPFMGLLFQDCEIRISRGAKSRFWAKGDPQNHQFSIGFIRYFDVVKTRVSYSEKPNAFLMILDPFFDFGLGKTSFCIGFIRYFAKLFGIFKMLVFPLLYNGFPRFAKLEKRRSLLSITVMLFACLCMREVRLLRFNLRNARRFEPV